MACPKVDWIVGAAIILYYTTAITELVSSVPVGLVLSDYSGNCVFSTKVEYYTSAFAGGIKIDQFGSKHACEFCTYLTIITILYPLLYGSYSLYAICKSLENATQMWVLPALMINSLLFVLKFISSCVLSVGFSQLCSSVNSIKNVESCSEGQSFDWFEISNYPSTEPTTSYNGKHYYSYLTTAQSASWFCVVEWLLLVVLTFFHYRRNIRIRSGADQSSSASQQNTYGLHASGNQALPGNSIINPNYKSS